MTNNMGIFCFYYLGNSVLLLAIQDFFFFWVFYFCCLSETIWVFIRDDILVLLKLFFLGGKDQKHSN